MTLIKATLYDHTTYFWCRSAANLPQTLNDTIATLAFIMLLYISSFQPKYVTETVRANFVILTFY